LGETGSLREVKRNRLGVSKNEYTPPKKLKGIRRNKKEKKTESITDGKKKLPKKEGEVKKRLLGQDGGKTMS